MNIRPRQIHEAPALLLVLRWCGVSLVWPASCQVLTSRKIYQVVNIYQILTSCLLGWVGIFNHVSRTTEMLRPVEYFYNWSLKSWIFAPETNLMSKTWCILSSNTLFVFVVDATMGSVSICCGGCCWIVVVTPGLLNVTRQKIHWPRVRIISSACVWLLRSKLEPLWVCALSAFYL